MNLNKKTIEDVNVNGKRVLVRCDFNVPIRGGVITDDTRIRAALPTLKKILADGGMLILGSHLGRPKGEWLSEFSLAPVAARLSERTVRTGLAYASVAKDGLSAQVTRVTNKSLAYQKYTLTLKNTGSKDVTVNRFEIFRDWSPDGSASEIRTARLRTFPGNTPTSASRIRSPS